MITSRQGAVELSYGVFAWHDHVGRSNARYHK